MGIPVLLIKGILESGKSYFIKDSLNRKDFGDLGRILILSQEDGIEEFDEEFLKNNDASFAYLDRDEWESKAINDLVRKYKPQVIFVEMNETWGSDTFMPSYFDVQQVITVIDGTTFEYYFSSMRQMFYDMIKSSELVIANRCDYTQKTSSLKKNVKVINSACEVIALDNLGNQIKLESDLPFDLSKEPIEIGLKDFGDFYVDSFENESRYDNKIVKFECMALYSNELPPKTFVAGRGALTCCVDDIQTIGHLCAYETEKPENESWILLTAKIHYLDFNGGKRIVLEYLKSERLPMPSADEQLVKLI